MQLTFDDILLTPQYSEILSRKDIDLTSRLTNTIDLPSPLIGANMDTIASTNFALSMHENGGCCFLHRNQSIENTINQVAALQTLGAYPIIASVGVKGDYLFRTEALLQEGVQGICIDIAHGHSLQMKQAIQEIKKLKSNYDFFIVAGNICTKEAYWDLEYWGADVVKVGIGPGSVCTTRLQTGHGYGQFSSLLEISHFRGEYGPTIIADGGMKNAGDIVKALAAGADCIMSGYLFREAQETNSGIYRGMASSGPTQDLRGEDRFIEGTEFKVENKKPLKDIMVNLLDGIRSGMSYSGISTMKDKHKIKWQQISSSVNLENQTRK